MKIEEEPLFHVDEANPFLYDVIMDLREVKVISVLYVQYFLMSGLIKGFGLGWIVSR